MSRSLHDRLSRLQPSQEGCPLRQETVGSVFRAVGLLTHMPYPARRLRQFEDLYKITEGQHYPFVLSFALHNMESEDWQEDGELLMEQLLIEPFAAIHKTFKEENDNDHV